MISQIITNAVTLHSMDASSRIPSAFLDASRLFPSPHMYRPNAGKTVSGKGRFLFAEIYHDITRDIRTNRGGEFR